MTETSELILPITYEETVGRVGNDIAKMAEFIVPVTEFEEQIIQVISDIRQSGYILFLYGVPGVGKSTFISSLVWRAHIPIRKILNINASDLSDSDQPDLKLRRLYAKINQIVKEDKKMCPPKIKIRYALLLTILRVYKRKKQLASEPFFEI
jgi:ABC-type ATPase involved in cell division